MQDRRHLIETYCLRDTLECYDPYDVWMTPLGIQVKQLFNKNKFVGILPAATLTIWDNFLNNNSRFLYEKQEYPTVRATAALTLLNTYKATKEERFLVAAKKHIDWLIDHSCQNYSGLCWGLGFKWAAGEGLDYNENTPFSTHTPYVLEAIDRYIQASGDNNYLTHVQSIYRFYEDDLKIMFENTDTMATSYGPDYDRVITNAVSYSMYAYAIFSKYMKDEAESIQRKIKKLYNFVVSKQLPDGSWLYEPDSADSFIDCFHSCFVLKNIFKANQIMPMANSEAVLKNGYAYVKENFYDKKHKLFKRFTLSNKPSMVKFDLYDNAEVLHLAVLLDDHELVHQLTHTIQKQFVSQNEIYSIIDILHLKRNKNTLRWAAMPYMYALSAIKNAKR